MTMTASSDSRHTGDDTTHSTRSTDTPHAKPAATVRVAFQGELGAYGDEAITRYWGDAAHPVPVRTFAAVFESILAGEADHGVVPVWNSTVGEVRAANDALQQHAQLIVVTDNVLIPIRHALLALPGASLDSVRYVGSHPVALAQCARLFVANPTMKACDAIDTAGAARDLACLAADTSTHRDASEPTWFETGCPNAQALELAVIASVSAGKRYGLTVLATNVQDEPTNATRFAVVGAREPRRW
jgi:prephenate dehydratase